MRGFFDPRAQVKSAEAWRDFLHWWRTGDADSMTNVLRKTAGVLRGYAKDGEAAELFVWLEQQRRALKEPPA